MSVKNKNGKINILAVLLIAGICALVAARELFVGLSADEEYQLVLSYRLAHGDRLFAESWDTLQTSAFFGQFLMWLFLKIFRTATGSLLFLRLCGIFTQLAVSGYLFSTLKKHIGLISAGLLSAGFFCTFTKLASLPEFANMQTWSLVVMICLLWNAKDSYDGGNKKRGDIYVIEAALAFCVTVLSTACIIMIPAVAVLLARLCKGGGLKRNGIFFGTCAVTGVLYIGLILLINGVDRTVYGIKGMIFGDDTHMGENLLNGNSKIAEYLKDFGTIAMWLAVTFALALLVSFLVKVIRKQDNALLMPAWIAESFAVALFNWFVKKTGYEGLKLYIPVMAIIGVIYYVSEKKKNNDEEYVLPFYGIILGLFAFINVLLISNVSVICNLSFLNTAALWGFVTMAKKAENRDEVRIRYLQAAFLLTMAVGTVFTLNSGPMGNTVFSLDRPQFIVEGPAKGTIVSKNVSDIYNINTRLFREMVKEKSSVLIVTDFFHNQSLTALYMINDVNISHYTVNSTPTYGDTLYDYWEEYPEKYPDVVVFNMDSSTEENRIWTEKLLSESDDWVTDSLYSVFYYVKPDCVRQEYMNEK